MIICGIDPGYDRTGYAFLEVSSNAFNVLSYGLISTDKKSDLSSRLYELGKDCDHLFTTYKPSCLYMEKLFIGRNASTALSVAEARGILRYIAKNHDMSIIEIPPSAVKKNITGYGAAKKDQMIRAVTSLLKLPTPPKPDDIADALAIAFCGYLQTRF